MKKIKFIFAILFFFLLPCFLNSLTIFLDCDDDKVKDYLTRNVKIYQFSNIKSESDIFFVIKTFKESNNLYYTLISFGQKNYQNISDTIYLTFDKNISEFELFDNIYKSFLIMILKNYFDQKYLENFTISEKEKLDEEVKEYGWNHNLEGITELYSEKQYKNNFLKIKYDGNRFFIDDQLKFEISFSIGKKYFYLDTARVLTSLNRTFFSEIEYIQAIDEKLSSRVKVDGFNSIYSNYKFKNDLSFGIEYSFFPYSYGNTKLLKISYEYEPSFVIYYDTTIYNKTKEILHRNVVTFSYETLFPKGSVSVSVVGKNYIQYFNQYSVSLEGKLKFYFLKGLSLNIYGFLNVPRDQRNIPKTGYTDEDILLLQKERATDYEFYLSGSISYSWGSKFRNSDSFRF